MRQVTHALLTRPPLSHSSIRRNRSASFDLHVLSTPPAFILSQDQTLVKSVCSGQNHLLAILPYFTVFGFVLEFSHTSNCSCTRKLCFLVHGASPNARLQTSLKINFHPVFFARQFSAFSEIFRNSFIVIYCLIINVLAALLRQPS